MWFEVLSPILFDIESFCRYSRKFDISKRVKACRGVRDQQKVRNHFGIRLIYRTRTSFPSSFCFAVPSFFRFSRKSFGRKQVPNETRNTVSETLNCQPRIVKSPAWNIFAHSIIVWRNRRRRLVVYSANLHDRITTARRIIITISWSTGKGKYYN